MDRRLTLQEVRAAYEKCGAKPCSGKLFSEDGSKACALGAIAMAHGQNSEFDEAWPYSMLPGLEDMDEDYLAGCWQGFDWAFGGESRFGLTPADVESQSAQSGHNQRYVDGYCDGATIGRTLAVSS